MKTSLVVRPMCKRFTKNNIYTGKTFYLHIESENLFFISFYFFFFLTDNRNSPICLTG